MIIPIRCFTCNNIIASKYNTYKKLLDNDKNKNKNLIISDFNINKLDSNKEIFNKININRYCCKRILLSHIDLYNNI